MCLGLGVDESRMSASPPCDLLYVLPGGLGMRWIPRADIDGLLMLATSNK